MDGFVGIIIALTTVATVGGSLFFVFKLLGGIHKKQGELQQLIATGQPATGRILGIGATGMSMAVMGHRHIDLALTIEVNVPGRPPYTVQTSQLISELRLPSVQPGALVQLRVDPMNPNRVAVADGAPPGSPMGGPPPGGGWGAPQAAGGWGGAPMAGPPGGPPPGGGWGAQPVMGANVGMGMGMQAGMGMQPMGAPGMGFVAPDLGQAMKRSFMSPMMIFTLFITTVPITVIMLATFVDWSAFASDDEPTKASDGATVGTPAGGYCEGMVRCCKVVFQGTSGASSCDQMKGIPAAGCKTAYEGYLQSAKANGKTCQ